LVHEQLQAAPDRLQQLVAGQNLIAVCHENVHQAESGAEIEGAEI
jgi:hypothetical protein